MIQLQPISNLDEYRLLPKVTHLVYLEIQIESEQNQEEEILGGRIVIALFGEVAPKTVENFKCLCTGEKGIGSIYGKVSTSCSVVFCTS